MTYYFNNKYMFINAVYLQYLSPVLVRTTPTSTVNSVTYTTVVLEDM